MKNLEKSIKLTVFIFFILFFFHGTKKGYTLSFPIFGGRDSTRALHSSPFQGYKNLKKSPTITFFQQQKIYKFFSPQKMLFSQFSNIRRMRFDQSSPVQPVSEIKKSQKISTSPFFQKKNFNFFCSPEKKKMLSSQFSNIRRTRFDQSSPFQPVSESRGGSMSVTENKRTNEGNPRV